MISYLYGSDSFRRNKKLAELIGAFEKEGGFSERMDADLDENPESWKDVRDFSRQQSIFGGSKLVVVKEGASAADKAWVKFLKEALADASVRLFISDAKKPLKAFEFLLKKPSESYAFGELSGRELSAFIAGETKERGFVFSPDALAFFLGYLGGIKEGKSWIASAEIEKAGFLGKKTVSLDDLKGISSFPDFDEVWVLSGKLIRSERWLDRIVFLEKLFLEGADAGHIFNSLALQARGKDLLRLSEYDIAIKSGRLDLPEALLSFALDG